MIIPQSFQFVGQMVKLLSSLQNVSQMTPWTMYGYRMKYTFFSQARHVLGNSSANGFSTAAITFNKMHRLGGHFETLSCG